jgi:ribose transport system substrate-binding protein
MNWWSRARLRAIGGMAVAAVISVVFAVGCGGSDNSSLDESGSGGGSTTAAGGGGKVAYSTTKLLDAYTVIMSNLVQRDAKEMGLDMLPTVDSNADAAKQVTDFTTLLGQGVRGILVTANDSKAIKAALDQAEAKGVPVVSADTGPAPGAGTIAMSVRVSGVAMGEQACRVIGDALRGKGTVLEMQGALTNPAGIDRSRGFQDCMKANFPDVKIISKPANFVQEDATKAAEAVLTTSDVDGIFLASDAAYLPGVIDVMKRLKKLQPVGEAGHIALVTIDGSPFSLDEVRKGDVDVVISQPLTGFVRYGLDYLKRAMAGETFRAGPTDHDSEIKDTDGLLEDYLNAELVTRDNVDDASLWGNQAK